MCAARKPMFVHVYHVESCDHIRSVNIEILFKYINLIINLINN